MMEGKLFVVLLHYEGTLYVVLCIDSLELK